MTTMRNTERRRELALTLEHLEEIERTDGSKAALEYAADQINALRRSLNRLSTALMEEQGSRGEKEDELVGIFDGRLATIKAAYEAREKKLVEALRAMMVATSHDEPELFYGHREAYLLTVARPRANEALEETEKPL